MSFSVRRCYSLWTFFFFFLSIGIHIVWISFSLTIIIENYSNYLLFSANPFCYNYSFFLIINFNEWLFIVTTYLRPPNTRVFVVFVVHVCRVPGTVTVRRVVQLFKSVSLPATVSCVRGRLDRR